MILLALAAPFAVARLVTLSEQAPAWRKRAVAEAEVRRLARAPGVGEAIARCGRVAADFARARLAVAWDLELPLDGARGQLGGVPGHVFARRGERRFEQLQRQARGDTPASAHASRPGPVRLVARSPRWGLFAVGCER